MTLNTEVGGNGRIQILNRLCRLRRGKPACLDAGCKDLVLLGRSLQRIKLSNWDQLLLYRTASIPFKFPKGKGIENRGNALLKMDQLPESIADFEKFLRLAPHHPEDDKVRWLVAEIRKQLNAMPARK